MVGPRAEREGQSQQEPQRIITDNTSFEIIIPNIGKRIYLTYTPEGALITLLESLTQPEEERLALETHFTGVVREMMIHSLEFKAGRLVPGSETITHELEALDLEAPFKDGVSKLADMHYSNTRVKTLVTDQAKLFSAGETHMGFMPSIVKEEVVKLHGIIEDYYNQRAKQHTGSRPRRPNSSR